MIKKELHFVWITKDGKKFLDRDQAEKHNDLLIDPKDIVEQWADKQAFYYVYRLHLYPETSCRL